MKKKNIILMVALLVFAGLFLENYGQYQLSAVPTMVADKFNVGDIQYSSILTAAFVPAIFLSIVLGLLVDKFGLSPMLLICFTISAVGFVLRVFATDYITLFIAMMLTGVGYTILNGNLSKIVASLYPMEKVSKIVGIMMAGSTGAMAVAYATTAYFPNLTVAFWVTAIYNVVLVVAWAILVREKYFHMQEEDNGADSQPKEESVPIMESIKVCLKSVNVWIMGIALMTMLGGATVISNFQVKYLVNVREFDEALAGTFGTVLMIGSILGSMLIPIVMDKFKKPAVFLGIIGLIAAVCTFGMVMLPTAGIYVASFVNGFTRSGIIAVLLSYPVRFSDIGPKFAGTAGGVASTLEFIGAVVLPTYVVIPVTGGNITAYFYVAALLIAIAAVSTYVATSKLKN
jgi:NNP family nitrate/nitrite transporter-like MFS transporter